MSHLASRRQTQPLPYGLPILGMLLLLSQVPNAAQGASIYYDQGSYRIVTTTDELFLGRYPDGSPYPDGSYLHNGVMLPPTPATGFEFLEWTAGTTMLPDPDCEHRCDIWFGTLVAEPGYLISEFWINRSGWLGLAPYHIVYESYSLLVTGPNMGALTDSLNSDTGTSGSYAGGNGFSKVLPSPQPWVTLRYMQAFEGSAHKENGLGTSSVGTNQISIGAALVPAPVPLPATLFFLVPAVAATISLSKKNRARPA